MKFLKDENAFLACSIQILMFYSLISSNRSQLKSCLLSLLWVWMETYLKDQVLKTFISPFNFINFSAFLNLIYGAKIQINVT